MNTSHPWFSKFIEGVSKDIRYGFTAKGEDSGTYRLLRITDIDGKGNLKEEGLKFASPEAKDVEKFLIRKGDLLIARSGASVGKPFLAREDMDAVFASYLIRIRLDEKKIYPEFFFYYCLSPLFQDFINRTRRGAAVENINAKNLALHEFLIPSIDEQKRIVAQIENYLNRLEEITQLHHENNKTISEMKLSLVLGEQRSDRDWVEVGELVDWIKDTEPTSDNETYNFVGAKSFGKGLFHSATRTIKDFKYQELRRLQHRDFTYPKLMAWEGAFGMVPKEFDRFVVSPEFVVFRTKDGIIYPEVLDTYFRSPICLEDVRNASTGSNKRRRRLNPQAFLKLKVPVPPHDVQEQLKKVYEFEAKAAESWKDLPETLEKIRQGILKKAFSGEL